MENLKRKEYTEILEILNHMEESDRKKVPEKLIKIFEENKDDGYEFEINPLIDLKEQSLMKETLSLIAMINLNYWCDTQEEKQKWIKIYSDNQKKYEEELRKKYNPDDIFKNKKAESIKTNETSAEKRIEEKSLIIVKENVFEKLWKKIKTIFLRKTA